MKKIYTIITFLLIGVFIISGFSKIDNIQSFNVDIVNTSARNYSVCVYCYGLKEGEFNIGWGKSTTIAVPCTTSNLIIKYGTYSCTLKTAYKSGYNEYTLN